MSDDTSHLIRWGIPGWCLIFFLLSFLAQNYFITHENPAIVSSAIDYLEDDYLRIESDVLGISVETKGNSADNIMKIFIMVIGAFSAIPLGFLIYQVYYFCWWVLFLYPRKWKIVEVYPSANEFNRLLNAAHIKQITDDLTEQNKIRNWALILTFLTYIPPLNFSLYQTKRFRHMNSIRRNFLRQGHGTGKISIFRHPIQRLHLEVRYTRMNFSYRVRRRMAVLEEKKEHRCKWYMIHALWFEQNQGNIDYIEEFRRSTYLFHALGAITYSVGGAFILFFALQMLGPEWEWHFRKPSLDLFWYSLSFLAVLLIVGGITALFFWWRKGKKMGEGSTSKLLMLGTTTLIIEYLTLGAVRKHLDGSFPYDYQNLLSIAAALAVTAIIVTTCRVNRKNIVKSRNMLMAQRFATALGPSGTGDPMGTYLRN
ncbi:MAG: hypothetical protein ACYC5A_07985 [Thermoleophilia bacterium]